MLQSPEEIIQKWMHGINDGVLDKVTSLYNTESILIPTFSNTVLKNPAAIRNYFERLASREDLSVSLHEKTLTTQNLGNHITILSGVYRWQFKIEDELMVFQARFTYCLNLSLSAPILHHHSSQIPRML
jgi:hypothetical protein